MPHGNAPGDISELLNLLRHGDILTHAFSGAGNNKVQNGRVLPAALEGHGPSTVWKGPEPCAWAPPGDVSILELVQEPVQRPCARATGSSRDGA